MAKGDRNSEREANDSDEPKEPADDGDGTSTGKSDGDSSASNVPTREEIAGALGVTLDDPAVDERLGAIRSEAMMRDAYREQQEAAAARQAAAAEKERAAAEQREKDSTVTVEYEDPFTGERVTETVPRSPDFSTLEAKLEAERVRMALEEIARGNTREKLETEGSSTTTTADLEDGGKATVTTTVRPDGRIEKVLTFVDADGDGTRTTSVREGLTGPGISIVEETLDDGEVDDRKVVREEPGSDGRVPMAGPNERPVVVTNIDQADADAFADAIRPGGPQTPTGQAMLDDVAKQFGLDTPDSGGALADVLATVPGSGSPGAPSPGSVPGAAGVASATNSGVQDRANDILGIGGSGGGPGGSGGGSGGGKGGGRPGGGPAGAGQAGTGSMGTTQSSEGSGGISGGAAAGGSTAGGGGAGLGLHDDFGGLGSSGVGSSGAGSSGAGSSGAGSSGAGSSGAGASGGAPPAGGATGTGSSGGGLGSEIDTALANLGGGASSEPSGGVSGGSRGEAPSAAGLGIGPLNAGGSGGGTSAAGGAASAGAATDGDSLDFEGTTLINTAGGGTTAVVHTEQGNVAYTPKGQDQLADEREREEAKQKEEDEKNDEGEDGDDSDGGDDGDDGDGDESEGEGGDTGRVSEDAAGGTGSFGASGSGSRLDFLVGAGGSVVDERFTNTGGRGDLPTVDIDYSTPPSRPVQPGDEEPQTDESFDLGVTGTVNPARLSDAVTTPVRPEFAGVQPSFDPSTIPTIDPYANTDESFAGFSPIDASELEVDDFSAPAPDEGFDPAMEANDDGGFEGGPFP